MKFESGQYSILLDQNYDGYERVGLLQKFQINSDVSFSWNGPNMIMVHVNGKVSTKGLCGNNNNDENDDLSAKNGLPGKLLKF